MFKTEAEAHDDFNERILSDGWIPFDGQNCDSADNDCAGWDGESRRCSCGNRRVSLMVEQSMSTGLWYWWLHHAT